MKEVQKKRNQAGIFLPNQKVSWAIATLLFLCFTMFAVGYFWGQRRAVSAFLGKIEEESFADKITYSLYAMNGQYADEESNDADEGSEDADDEGEETSSEIVTITPSEPLLKDHKAPEEAQPESLELDIKKVPEKVYVAPIVGFGTLHAAQSFVDRVKKSGIDIVIKDRESKTPKGKKITWYQAVSQEYEDKSELQNILALIQKKENIKDIKIIEKRKVHHSC